MLQTKEIRSLLCTLVVGVAAIGFSDDEALQRRNEATAVRIAAATLRAKIARIDEEITRSENLIKTFDELHRIAENAIGFGSLPESERKQDVKGEIREFKERRQELQRQLDYVETYKRLPPDSFFQKDGSGSEP